jgi:hypothetical protein
MQIETERTNTAEQRSQAEPRQKGAFALSRFANRPLFCLPSNIGFCIFVFSLPFSFFAPLDISIYFQILPSRFAIFVAIK